MAIINKATKATKKPVWAVEKHLVVLKDTLFRRCASCSGTSGKIREDGLMCCSRAGPIPVPVTEVQAQCCDGTSPILLPERIKKIRPMNRLPAP